MQRVAGLEDKKDNKNNIIFDFLRALASNLYTLNSKLRAKRALSYAESSLRG